MYPFIEIIVRVVILLLLLYLMIRWLGKKHLTQMTIFEYISGIVLGGAVAIHISSNAYPLLHGIIAIFAWTLLIVCIDTIALKSKRFRDFIHGRGRTMIHDGSFIYEHLKEERMTRDELLGTLRTRNIDQLSDVEFAQLEPSGKLNVRTYQTNDQTNSKNVENDEINKRIDTLLKEMENNLENPTKVHILSSIEQVEQLKSLVMNKATNSSGGNYDN